MSGIDDYWRSVNAIDQIPNKHQLAVQKAEQRRGEAVTELEAARATLLQRSNVVRGLVANAIAVGRSTLVGIDEAQRLPERIRPQKGQTSSRTPDYERDIRRSIDALQEAARALSAHREASRLRRRTEAEERERLAEAAHRAEQDRQRREAQERLDKDRRRIRQRAQRVAITILLLIAIPTLAAAAVTGSSAVGIVGVISSIVAGGVAWKSLSSRQPTVDGPTRDQTRTTTRTTR